MMTNRRTKLMIVAILAANFAVFFIVKAQINMTDGTVFGYSSPVLTTTLDTASATQIYITATTATTTQIYPAKPSCIQSQATTYDQLLLENLYCQTLQLNAAINKNTAIISSLLSNLKR